MCLKTLTPFSVLRPAIRSPRNLTGHGKHGMLLVTITGKKADEWYGHRLKSPQGSALPMKNGLRL